MMVRKKVKLLKIRYGVRAKKKRRAKKRVIPIVCFPCPVTIKIN